MKFLKSVMIIGFWCIVIGIIFSLGRLDGASAMTSILRFLPIILVVAIIYGVVAGVKRLIQR